MHSTNYACMMKRIVTKESLIPNRQILDELSTLFGLQPIAAHAANQLGIIKGGTISG